MNHIASEYLVVLVHSHRGHEPGRLHDQLRLFDKGHCCKKHLPGRGQSINSSEESRLFVAIQIVCEVMMNIKLLHKKQS